LLIGVASQFPYPNLLRIQSWFREVGTYPLDFLSRTVQHLPVERTPDALTPQAGFPGRQTSYSGFDSAPYRILGAKRHSSQENATSYALQMATFESKPFQPLGRQPKKTVLGS
jgi:hypothetical protein